MSGTALADAAETLIGTRFRLHGRDPATGLDCIGLLAFAGKAVGLPIDPPTGYRLRNRSHPEPDALARLWGLIAARDDIARGDVLAVRPGPFQLHLLVALSADTFIHAHAGMGRVVVQSGGNPWPCIGHWRVRQPN